MKRTVPLVITFLSGLVMIVPYYVSGLEGAQDVFLDWYKIISVFAYVLGVSSLVMVNGQKIVRKSAGWGYNAVLLVSLVVTLGFGIAGNFEQGTLSYYIFQYVFNPLSATMFSLLAFFIASAAFRAFKAKTVEATLLLTSAIFVMIGRVPPGEMLWQHLPWLNQWRLGDIIDTWVMGTFNAAGQRAILIGSSIGLISISLKILLGVERSYLGGDES
ncbi:MAG TPA: hypothetical protein VGO93_00595 [Candidatus Xenobia bacterium]|jgi:hypothetical protein